MMNLILFILKVLQKKENFEYNYTIRQFSRLKYANIKN